MINPHEHEQQEPVKGDDHDLEEFIAKPAETKACCLWSTSGRWPTKTPSIMPARPSPIMTRMRPRSW